MTEQKDREIEKEVAEMAKDFARAFVENGYRKIPDGAVVLMGREYQSLRESLSETTNRECELAERARNLLHENDDLKAENKKLFESIENLTSGKCAMCCPLAEQIRKETAREILNRIANHLPAFQYETLSEAQRNLVTNEDWLNAYLLKELAREYGVEVEE